MPVFPWELRRHGKDQTTSFKSLWHSRKCCPKTQWAESYKMHLLDVLQVQLLDRKTFGLSRNKWACVSQAFNPLCPGWPMYQQTLVLELCLYRVPLVGRRCSHGRKPLWGATAAFYELVACELSPRGENDTKSIAQINTCSDVFPGDRPDGRLKVNIVRTKSGHSKIFQMGTRSSALIRAISTHTLQAPTKH